MEEQRKKACFIIPYFGKLPNTFPVYLRTCAQNPDFDWLIITDDRTDYDYPENVHCSYTTFDDFVNRVQACFDFPIALKRPYKICDFRAAFGVIFAEELREYRFWGHCDLDQYFGKINHFITDEVLDNYEKILCLGHFTLFRNVAKINEMYKIPDQTWGQSYQDAFSQEKHWIFDEWPAGNTCINRIMKQENVKTFYYHDAFSDLMPFVSRFQRLIFNHETEAWTKEDIHNSVYVWQDGELFACHKDKNGKILRCEMLYVHIRQRKMDCADCDVKQPIMCIYPNKICSLAKADDKTIAKIVRQSLGRGMLRPDEMGRQWVILRGYFQAAVRRGKQLFKR